MPLARRHFLTLSTAFALPCASAAQEATPSPTPRLIKRADWSATPLWRARIEARQGLVLAEVTVLRRLENGLILLVREEPPGVIGDAVAQHVRLERRDAEGRVVWQQRVSGLPSRFGTFVSRYAPGSGTQRSLLVMTFLPGDHRRMAAYGRIVEFDEAAGQVRALGAIARPRTKTWIDGEVFEVHGARRLDGDRVLLYGGFGSGPYAWWIAAMRLDGTVLWQAMSQSSAGEVSSMRVVPGGFEASVFIIMSWPNTANVGLFRMRFDEAGRITGSLKVATGRALLFTADGTAITLGEGEPRVLGVEDRQGRRRTVALLKTASEIRQRLDDGSFLLYDTGDHDLIVAGDGRTSIHLERDVRSDTIIADGSIFTAACLDDDKCQARDLALYRRPW